MLTLFDSRDPRCKTPFGAVATEETITFTIHLPKGRVWEPSLRLYRMDHWDDQTPFPMKLWESNLVTNSYRCEFTPQNPCLYAY